MATVLFVSSFGVMVIAASIYTLVQQYNSAVDATARAARNSVMAVKSHAAQTFGETFRVLDGIADLYKEELEQGRVSEAALHALMAGKLDDVPAAISIFIFDENRKGVAGARSIPFDIARLYETGYAFDTYESVGSGLFVAPPYKNAHLSTKRGVLFLPVGAEVWDKNDVLRGYVIAILDTRFFSDYYNALDVGGHGRISMWTSQGQLIAANINEAAKPGDFSVAAAAQINAQKQIPANAQEISLVTVSGVVNEIVAPARVGDLPLFMSVNLDSHDFLAAWRTTRSQITLAAAAIVLTMTVFAFIILRQLKHTELNEIALRYAKATAEEANDAKSRFLAHMSHEFRTPLNAIMGFSEIIKNKVLGDGIAPAYTSYADYIYRSGEHLLHIVNDILDMAKIESGAQPVHQEAIDMHGVIAAAVSFVEGMAARKGVHIRVAAPPHMPQVSGDQRFSRQVLINLLSNAIKFSPQNTDIVIAAQVQPDKYLEISVTDQGPGIEPALLRRLGEPFLQSNPTLSQSGQGTGLGLSICKRYMDLLGGELVINSTVGAGTTAIIRFPKRLLIDTADNTPTARSVA